MRKRISRSTDTGNLEALKAEYEREYYYIVRGSIICSRATWFEQGERNTKYFLILENNNKKKSCIRKLLQENGKECTDSNIISNEIYNFYSDLYDEKEGMEINELSCPFVGNHSFIPKLNVEQRDLCEDQLTYAECYKVQSTFENNKTPGNDGLNDRILQIRLARNRYASCGFIKLCLFLRGII